MRTGTRLPVLLAVLLLIVASCGGEAVDVANYPDFSGSWQYRSILTQGDIVCTENGELMISHPGQASFSGSAQIQTDCFEGMGFLSSNTETFSISSGTFGDETARGSWTVSFSARPGWTYSGEGFEPTGGSLAIQGSGTAVFDPGDGQTLSVSFPWTICKRFADQSDPVERSCG